MTLDQYNATYGNEAQKLITPRDCAPVTPGASDYSFGVALALQCDTGGEITVITAAGNTRTITLRDGARLDCPTTRCTAFAGTNLIAYI